MKKLFCILLFVPFTFFGQENDPCYSINDYNLLTELNNPQIEINLVSGWNMIGYPCAQQIVVSDAFSSIVNEITIVKDNNGNVYMPEFGFNGIGFLEGGQGYQIKMTDFVLGFTFCQSIQFPTIEGCIDCAAVNFSKLATTDDGSCNYDSDGDGIPDSEEVAGCQDASACNYDITATDVGECNYPQDGYDCEGNIYCEIGDTAFGGVVFYFDSIDLKGFVMYNELPDNWNVGGGVRPWGCSNYYVPDCGYTSLEYSLHNTMQIYNTCNESSLPNMVWTEYLNAATTAIDLDVNTYSNWFLPSLDLTILMVDNLLGSINEIGNTSVWTSTQVDETDAYWVSGQSGEFYTGYKSSSNRVIPVRAFGNWTMGCWDSEACNYNPDVNMPDGSCEYAELGYDCEGNITEYLVGMEAEGGIVFYVDETGEHGLVAAMEDIGQFGWGCYALQIDGADGTVIGTGYQNTIDIVAGCTDEPIAASESLAYESNGFDDWYLPSIDELYEMYNTIGKGGPEGNIGEFTDYWYRSSSEFNNIYHWAVWFLDGSMYTSLTKNSSDRYVRPIRSF